MHETDEIFNPIGRLTTRVYPQLMNKNGLLPLIFPSGAASVCKIY